MDKSRTIQALVSKLYETITETADEKGLDFGECLNVVNCLAETFISATSPQNQQTIAATFCQILMMNFEPLRNENLWPPKQQVQLALSQLDNALTVSFDGQRIDVAIAAVCHVMSNPPSMLTRPLNG